MQKYVMFHITGIRISSVEAYKPSL